MAVDHGQDRGPVGQVLHEQHDNGGTVEDRRGG
jgi:hypothetical protein